MKINFSQVIDLQSLNKPKREERKTAIGSVIIGGYVGAGRYLDHGNIGHVAVKIVDSEIRDGEPRYYLINKSAALELAAALTKAAGEVAL